MKTAHPLSGRRHTSQYGSCARHISDMAVADSNSFVLLAGRMAGGAAAPLPTKSLSGSGASTSQSHSCPRLQGLPFPTERSLLHGRCKPVSTRSLPMIDATPLLRLHAQFRLARLARQHAVKEQKRQLLRLVGKAQGTRFGRDHGFAEVRTIGDLQERVPLRRYEDMWKNVETLLGKRVSASCRLHLAGTIPFIALTSGTPYRCDKIHSLLSRNEPRERLGGDRSPRPPCGKPAVEPRAWGQEPDARRQYRSCRERSRHP